MIRVRKLSLHYGETKALNGLDLDIADGECVTVTGASGSGKTSLLMCLAGLEKPTDGTVRHGELELSSASIDRRASWRLETAGFVFQAHNLIPELTLRDNIALPLELLRRKRVRESVSEMVDRLGLSACADRKPARVSGGQAQRAAVARALIHSPTIIFADEPTGALDRRNRDIVLQLMRSEVESLGSTLIMVTHDTHATWPGMRIVEIADGRIAGESHQ